LIYVLCIKKGGVKMTKEKKESKITEKVEEAINDIRPSLQADGGDVELVEVTGEGIVKVRLMGACSGCMMAQVTLKSGIENYLKEQIPEVKEVVSVF
jgi:Fe-S cluster biogenesis protein NfuA